jgi:hypothetical protein
MVFSDGLAVDELPFAAAGGQFSLAENLEMVRDGRGADAAHGNISPQFMRWLPR